MNKINVRKYSRVLVLLSVIIVAALSMVAIQAQGISLTPQKNTATLVAKNVESNQLHVSKRDFFSKLHDALEVSIQYFIQPSIHEIYSDVMDDDSDALIIYDLYTLGIVDDVGCLNPDKSLTREEMAHYIVNSYCHKNELIKSEINYKKRTIDDAQLIDAKYTMDVNLSIDLDLMTYHKGQAFEPRRNATMKCVKDTIKRLGIDENNV